MCLFENGANRGQFLQLAYEYLLTIPPTSVESERAFSVAGSFATKDDNGRSKRHEPSPHISLTSSELNKFFVHVGERIAREIPVNNVTDKQKTFLLNRRISSANSCFFNPVSQQEMEE
ncbi:hypothetical protein QE152_g15633 [Popillia japonica]|uniref:HAT C-terminal dimerisation domain-containing protein n=1 Tax=Popillia japonica TaxID=7064 RepID=A0AAW1L8H8_POPJA